MALTLPIREIDISKPSQEDIQLQLHQACKTTDSDKVSQCVEAGANLNRMAGLSFNDMDYPLATAVHTQSLPFVQFLLDSNAAPQISAIKAAAGVGNVPILELLLIPIKDELAKREDESAVGRWKTGLAAALRRALMTGQSGTAKVLMVFRDRMTARGGTSFEKCVRQGFISAAVRGDEKMMRDFLEWGAIDCPDVLKVLADQKQFSMLLDLLVNKDFHRTILDRALSNVAKAGEVTLLQLLISKGAQDNGAALNSAVYHSQIFATKALLEMQEYTTTALTLALSKAAGKGDLATMDMLLNAGAECGKSLEDAARHGRPQALQVLLNRFSHTSEDLSKALVEATLEWGRQQELNRKEMNRNRLQMSALNRGPETECMRHLIQAGGVLTDETYLQIIEIMIMLGNETGVIQLLTDGIGYDGLPNYTTMRKLPDNYLLALATYHGRGWKMVHALWTTPVASPMETIDTDQAPANENASTNPIYTKPSPGQSGLFTQPCPTPLLAVILTKGKDMAYCKTFLERYPQDLERWTDYLPNSQGISYYSKPLKPSKSSVPCLRNSFGPTPFTHKPLTAAIEAENIELIGLLLDHGADPWLASPTISILELAAQRSLLRTLFFSIHPSKDKHIDPNLDEKEGHDRRSVMFSLGRSESHTLRKILHYAALYAENDPSLVSDLLALGAPVDAKDRHGLTAMHLAVEKGHLETVEVLLWAGAGLDARCTHRLSGQFISGGATMVEYARVVAAGSQSSDNPPVEGAKVERKSAEEKVEDEELRERREKIVELLERWEKVGGLGDADAIRRGYEEHLANANASPSKEKDVGGRIEEVAETLSEIGDDESLHLSDADDHDDEEQEEKQTDEDREEWEFIEENPEEL